MSSGSYNLGLESLLPTDPVDATLAYGDVVGRDITEPAQIDQLTFSGDAGRAITLTLAVTSSFGAFESARAHLYTPTGAELLVFDGNSRNLLTLPETGTYVLQVRATNLVSSGSYNLGLESLLPTDPVDATLAYGDVVGRDITEPAQIDQLTFSGDAGGEITLTLAVTSSFGAFESARAHLFTPSGDELLVFDGNSSTPPTELPETGTYVLQVHATNLVSSGSYNMGLESITGMEGLQPRVRNGVGRTRGR